MAAPDPADASRPHAGPRDTGRTALLLRVGAIAALVLVAWLVRERLLNTDPRSMQTVLPVEIVGQRDDREDEEPEPEERPPEDEAEIPQSQTLETLAEIPDMPSDSLGLDATGVGGGDGFGLSARPGGRALTESGGGGGVAGDRLAALRRYAGLLQADLRAALEELEPLRQADYVIACQLWLDAAGNVEQAQLIDSTGDPEFDATIVRQLESVRGLPRPPRGLPQPVSIRLEATGSGRAMRASG